MKYIPIYFQYEIHDFISAKLTQNVHKKNYAAYARQCDVYTFFKIVYKIAKSTESNEEYLTFDQNVI